MILEQYYQDYMDENEAFAHEFPQLAEYYAIASYISKYGLYLNVDIQFIYDMGYRPEDFVKNWKAI